MVPHRVQEGFDVWMPEGHNSGQADVEVTWDVCYLRQRRTSPPSPPQSFTFEGLRQRAHHLSFFDGEGSQTHCGRPEHCESALSFTHHMEEHLQALLHDCCLAKGSGKMHEQQSSSLTGCLTEGDPSLSGVQEGLDGPAFDVIL